MRTLIGMRIWKNACAPNYSLRRSITLANLSSISKQASYVKGGQKILCRQKSKITVGLEDLPQGPIALEPLAKDSDEGSTYPTVVQQARNNMRKFENCVLLTRVGGFYELYFEHAIEYGPLLNLKVAQKRTNAGHVPMAGFPFFQLDRFLKILVQDLSKYVAISEEFPNNASKKVKAGGLLFDRKVTRVITPGTLIDEKFMNPFESNFVLAIYPEIVEAKSDVLGGAAGAQTENGAQQLQNVGLAWLDLSTGDFFTQSTRISTLSSGVARIGARELVVDSILRENDDHDMLRILEEEGHLITFHPTPDSMRDYSAWDSMLDSPMSSDFKSTFSKEEISAGGLLLSYVSTQLLGAEMKLRPPVRKQEIESMMIDKASMRALEIKSTLADGNFAGSLLHAIRRTVTKSGARLLSDWLTSPSTSIEIINHRLDLVGMFRMSEVLREEVISLLSGTFDSQRLVQKFSLGRGDPDDLVSLSRTVYATESILNVLKGHLEKPNDVPEGQELNSSSSIEFLLGRLDLDEPSRLAGRINDAIDEVGLQEKQYQADNEAAEMIAIAQGVIGQHASSRDLESLPKAINPKKSKSAGIRDLTVDDEVWVMRRGASITLGRLHDGLDRLKQEKTDLEERLRGQLDTPSLTLRWTPSLGHICHLKGKDTKASLASLEVAKGLSSSKSTRSIHVPEWTQLGSKIDQAKLQIRAEEQRIFHNLRRQVVLNLLKFRRNAAVLDELDIACSFASLAQEQRLVRPAMNKSTELKIIGGRHPTVKLGLEEDGRSFTPNDCVMTPDERVWLVTGPNMAGKSTFLRQNALIAILAQTGSYVPAQYAEIGIIDQIFSRVGSADNLYRDQSTFMVEMLETAHILNQATSRSLVIMDEVGRGTTPEDGIAVAFACLHHLHDITQCRTLFATHFHVIADFAKDLERLGCYCTDLVEDSQGGFSYLHRLRQGVNRQSHALKVARLAGLPDSAISVAGSVLRKLQNKSS